MTALIEFQAYSLVAFGAYLLGRAWLRPASVGADTRGGGYVGGLKQLGWIGALAFALFVVGAIWEAFSLRYLVHPPSELLL